MVAELAPPAASVGTLMMSADEARACVTRIKALAEEIAPLLMDVRDREGWKALGYTTWQDCLRQEFNMSRQRAHQLINAHIVERVLAALPPGPASNAFDAGKLKARHRVELAPIADQPERIDAVVERATESRGGKAIRAEDVRGEVSREIGRPVVSTPKPARSASSRGDSLQVSQDIPDDLALGCADIADEIYIDPPADAAPEIESQETYGAAPNAEKWCGACGGKYRGDACPCAAEAPLDADPFDGLTPHPDGNSAPILADDLGIADRPGADEAQTTLDPSPVATDAGEVQPPAATPALPASSISPDAVAELHRAADERRAARGYPPLADAASTISKGAGLGGSKSEPVKPHEYRPVIVDGKAPVSVYPTPEGLVNAIDSHISGEAFDELDRLYMEHRRQVMRRRQMNGSALSEAPGVTLNEADEIVKQLTDGQQMAELSRIFERLPIDKKRAVAKMATTTVERIDNPNALAAGWAR